MLNSEVVEVTITSLNLIGTDLAN